MVRNPVVAGQFYGATFNELDRQLQECFTGKRGPGVLPGKRGKGAIKGIIVPHAGYLYSGACAAWAYKELAESEFADIYIIMGPNHLGIGRSSSMMDDWQTPLGVVKSEKDFIRELVNKTQIELSNMPLLREHSVEVQLPFLQFASRDKLNDIRIVPIAVSEELNISKFALDLKELIMDYGKRAVIIASSDFTHYGPAYGYLPFELDKEKKLYELDAGAIKLIKDQNMEGFNSYVAQTGATICGRIAISVLMATLPKCNIKLLSYYTSGDVVNNYKNAVGYGSFVFK